MLYSLIYVSKTRQHLQQEQLAGLLQKARTDNQAIDVTGMLLYMPKQSAINGGRFIQALEGDKQRVLGLLDKIKADSRHEGLYIVSEEVIYRRNFEAWSMGFKSIIHDDEFAHLSNYINLNDRNAVDNKLSGISKPINYLKSFYQINQELYS